MSAAGPPQGASSNANHERHERTDLRRRRRPDAVPQVAQPAGAVRGVRSRDAGGARAAAASTLRADGARRGDPRLRSAVGGRGQHRPRRRAANGLRAEGPRLDGDAQLRVGDAGTRFGDQQHPRRPLESRTGRRRRCAVARAAALFGRDGRLARELVRGEDARPARRARRTVQALVSRAGDRPDERAHRPDRGSHDGTDRGESRVPLWNHATTDG